MRVEISFLVFPLMSCEGTSSHSFLSFFANWKRLLQICLLHRIENQRISLVFSRLFRLPFLRTFEVSLITGSCNSKNIVHAFCCIGRQPFFSILTCSLFLVVLEFSRAQNCLFIFDCSLSHKEISFILLWYLVLASNFHLIILLCQLFSVITTGRCKFGFPFLTSDNVCLYAKIHFSVRLCNFFYRFEVRCYV